MDRSAKVRGRWLALIALAIGVAVVGGEGLLFSLLTGRPMHFASDVEPFNALIVAFPFLVLAAMRNSDLLPWLTGLALQLALWGYALQNGVSYQRNPDGSGANIGLGLMIIASPIFITLACLAAAAVQRAWRAEAAPE